MMLMIATGIYVISSVSAKYTAYSHILQEGGLKEGRSKRAKKAEKLAAFYWPMLVAIYLGWSLWTMNWGETWIIWPVGAVLFVALIGLVELFDKDDLHGTDYQ